MTSTKPHPAAAGVSPYRLVARSGDRPQHEELLKTIKHGRVWHTTPRALERYVESIADKQ